MFEKFFFAHQRWVETGTFKKTNKQLRTFSFLIFNKYFNKKMIIDYKKTFQIIKNIIENKRKIANLDYDKCIWYGNIKKTMVFYLPRSNDSQDSMLK